MHSTRVSFKVLPGGVVTSATPRTDGRVHSALFRLRNIARWLLTSRNSRTGSGADYHFVRDYERLVTKMLVRYPVDEAMSRAVGGDFERVGAVQCAVLRHAGL